MIGHSNLRWEAFTALLEQSGVRRLLDVRTSPRSRWCPHFNADKLAIQLPALGIGYQHLPALGGKDPRPIPELRAAIAQLLPLPEGTCLMCSEADYHECHRHYLLAPLLLAEGVQIKQIQRDGSLTEDAGPTPATLEKMRSFLP